MNVRYTENGAVGNENRSRQREWLSLKTMDP